jgi:predicted DNA-binding transcriptional regulator AlpA
MKDEVLELLGISYPCLFGWIRDGKFPPGRSIGTGKKGHVAWIESEVHDWIWSRPARRPKGSRAA